MRISQFLILVTVATATLMSRSAFATTATVARQDFRITTADSVGIFVRELRPLAAASDREPLILVRGARVPGQCVTVSGAVAIDS